jgi:uncharacterized membrane protein
MEHDIPLIDDLIERGALDAERRAEVVDRLASSVPSRAQWGAFLHLVGLGFGTASILAGVVYLVAFNWAEIGIVTKLGMLSAALLGAAAGSVAVGPRSFGGQLLAAAAVVLTGSCLVVYSQVYQSGADAWTLFASWSALAVPLVLGARSPALWALQIVLIDATLGTWLGVHDRFAVEVVTAVALLHVAAAQLFSGTWLQHALRLVGVAELTFVACEFVTSARLWASEPIGAVALAAIFGGGLAVQGAFLVGRAGAPAAALSYTAAAAVAVAFLVDSSLSVFTRAEAPVLLAVGTCVVVITATGFAWVVGVPKLGHRRDGAAEGGAT